jgi:predicted sugar kinase
MNIERFEDSELSPDELSLSEKVNEVHLKLTKQLAEMEQMGVMPDIASARMDQLLNGLARIGVLTKQQYFELLLASFSNISSQLEGLIERRRDQIELAQADMRRQQREQVLAAQKRMREATGGIVTPPEKRLIVPPGTKRKK